MRSDRYLDVEWLAISAAQAPEYLFVCLQKSIDVMSLANSKDRQITSFNTYSGAAVQALPARTDDAEGERRGALLNQYYARCTDGNAAIVQFGCEVQSAVGSFTFASETEYPFVRTKYDLWRDHAANCVDGYCDGNMDTWQKHNSCLLIHASQYLRALTTPCTAFPIQLNIRARFENRREFICGGASQAPGCSGHVVCQDVMQGEPVLVLIYPSSSLTVTASSAASSTANFSHASALDILSRKL
jgi:hypothetical protein